MEPVSVKMTDDYYLKLRILRERFPNDVILSEEALDQMSPKEIKHYYELFRRCKDEEKLKDKMFKTIEIYKRLLSQILIEFKRHPDIDPLLYMFLEVLQGISNEEYYEAISDEDKLKILCTLIIVRVWNNLQT